MKVDEALVAELVGQGVGEMFTLIGDETVRFTGHAAASGIRIYGGRHETGTVGMADGYARVSGRVGLAVIARGPGVTNALTSIICASRARSGVVVLAGDSALATRQMTPEEALSRDPGHKYIAQERLLQAALVPSVTLSSPGSATADFREALLWAGRGETVVVNAPIDVLQAETGDDPPEIALPSASDSGHADSKQIQLMAEMLRDATWPVILAGRGAVRAEAEGALVRLAQASGALLSTSLLAKGYIAGDEHNVGVAGGLGTPASRELLSKCDLVLAFGCSLNPMTMYGGATFPNARIVQVDTDPGAFGRFFDVDLAVLGDAGLVATDLADRFGRADRAGFAFRTSEVAERIAVGQPIPRDDQGRSGSLDPRHVMYMLNELLPRDRTVVVDSGRQLTYPNTYLSVPDETAFIFPHDGGALGAGIGVGLGAAIARPDRLTVVCAGDGATMMSIADLETAVRYGLRLLLVVNNDSGFAGATVTLKKSGLPDDAARYPSPSFEAVARGLGAEGLTVTEYEDLNRLPSLIERMTGPVVVDCKITSEVVPEWVELLESIHRQRASV